jgi:prophage regulatory protein
MAIPARSLRPLSTTPAIDPILRLPAVKSATGWSGRTIYRKVKANEFPSPKRLGPNSIGWPASVIAAWKESLPDARDQAAA